MGEAHVDALKVKQIVIAELKRRGLIPPKVDPIAHASFEMGCYGGRPSDSHRIPVECANRDASPYVVGMKIKYEIDGAESESTAEGTGGG
jgi:hypothetical protein